MNISAVDLFCGAGGMTHGLERAGIDVTTGIDNARAGRYPYTENTNAEFVDADVEALAHNPERVARMYPFQSDLTVLAACAPCQPYSTMGHSRAGGREDHDKWGLLNSVQKIVEYVEPDVLVTENVLQVRNDGIYEEFEERLEELGYALNSDQNKNVYCPEYGIPQKRKRWVLIASKEGAIELPSPIYEDEDEYPTVRETIGHLPPIDAGEAHPELELHRARDLSDTNLERIRNIEPGQDWSVWEENGLDHLLADCHKRDSGRSYKTPYSRLRPDEPAPTITTQFYNYGSGRFGHYDTDQDRALSILEGALLQTFPQDYDFYDEWDDVGINNLGRLIGNAVPPRLAELAGRSICEKVGVETPRTSIVGPA
ncbi:DNA cytosine methyltransferase [Saliphagus sp. GCM10025308]